MKSLRLVLTVVLFSVSALAQMASTPAPPSEAQKSFEQMKSLAGSWEGPVSVDPPMPEMTDGHSPNSHISLRVTSRGHALVHEMQEANTPLDATKFDHPVTMFYVDGDKLT